mmetsp:Transcript_19781/g.54508  ORF Transcript_19781/g.54508 Transcript_19781/m.54508 type:complete len:200 (+) Transcript_19781:676-1275(+)
MPEAPLEAVGLRHHEQTLLRLEDPTTPIGQVEEPRAVHHAPLVDDDYLPRVQELADARIVRVRWRGAHLYVVLAHDDVIFQAALLPIVPEAEHARATVQRWRAAMRILAEEAEVHWRRDEPRRQTQRPRWRRCLLLRCRWTEGCGGGRHLPGRLRCCRVGLFCPAALARSGSTGANATVRGWSGRALQLQRNGWCGLPL